MEWIRICEADSLSNGDLMGFDHKNKRISIAKIEDKIYATDEDVRMNLLIFLPAS